MSLKNRVLELSYDLRRGSRMWSGASKENESNAEMKTYYYCAGDCLNSAAFELESIVEHYRSDDVARSDLKKLYDRYMESAKRREPPPPWDIVQTLSDQNKALQIARLILDPKDRGYYKSEMWFAIKLKELLLE